MAAQTGNVFIVNVFNVVDAERANLPARHEAAAAATSPATGTIAAVAITSASATTATTEASASFTTLCSRGTLSLFKFLTAVNHGVAHFLTGMPLERHVVHVFIKLLAFIFGPAGGGASFASESSLTLVTSAAEQANFIRRHLDRGSIDSVAIRVLASFKPS
jgi:hypothetical protein